MSHREYKLKKYEKEVASIINDIQAKYELPETTAVPLIEAFQEGAKYSYKVFEETFYQPKKKKSKQEIKE